MTGQFSFFFVLVHSGPKLRFTHAERTAQKKNEQYFNIDNRIIQTQF